MRFSTAILSALFAGVSFAAPHAGHRNGTNVGHGNGKNAGHRNGTTAGHRNGANATNVSSQGTITVLDETPGSGGSWTAIIDEEDPRTLDEMIAAMNLTTADLSHVYNNSAFQGFSASLSRHCVNALSTMSGFKFREPVMDIKLHDKALATWGQKRVSQSSKVEIKEGGQVVSDFNFQSYEFEGGINTLGKGVDIYVVDTGINIKHVDFDGRAKFGFAFDQQEIDDAGHGTHCAGTAASTTFGLAKAANLVAIRVLSGEIGGSSSDIINGLDKVQQLHDARKGQSDFRGSVVSMSLGSSEVVQALDDAITKMSKTGIHFSVAAGNDGIDACLSSPALASSDSTASIMSIGAVNVNDQRPAFTNVGRCVTVYAPGVDVTSTWNLTDTTINTISGTSMAAPHVTGLIAYYLGLNSSLALNPAAMKKLIVSTALPFKSAKKVEGDPSILVNNGFLTQA